MRDLTHGLTYGDANARTDPLDMGLQALRPEHENNSLIYWTKIAKPNNPLGSKNITQVLSPKRRIVFAKAKPDRQLYFVR